MLQVLVRIPIPGMGVSIPIYGFGMMLFIAFVVCTWLAGRRAEREGVTRETIQDLAIWVFLGGLLGARVAYLLLEQNPRPAGVIDFLAQLPRIWDGGIVLFGAVIGGTAAYAVAYFWIFRKRGCTTLQLCDIIAPAIAVGVGLGRFGCFLNGCCYGQVVCTACAVLIQSIFPLAAPPRYALSDAGDQTAAGFTFALPQPDEGAQVGQVEPWSAAARAGLKANDIITKADNRTIRKADELSAYLGSYGLWPRGKNDLKLDVRHQAMGAGQDLDFRPYTLGLQPTQLYETISMALLFLVLSAYYPLRTRRGQVVGCLMMGYAVHRYLNEMLRGDPRPVDFEWVCSIVLFLAGAALLIYLKMRPAELRPVPAPEQQPNMN